VTVEKEKKLYEVNITGYAHDGAGVGRVGGQVIFVPGALAGEKVLVELKEGRKGVFRGVVQEVLFPAKERQTPACEIFTQCGGCQLQHVSYPAQLGIKKAIVRQALERIGGFEDVQIQPVLGMENPWGYRNKGHFQVGYDRREHRVKLGFFAEGSHSLVQGSCRHLFSSRVTSLLELLEELLTVFRVKVAETNAGVSGSGLRHLLIRESKANGEILVVFIYSGKYCEKIKDISREIVRKYPEVVGICQSENKKKGGPVLGNKVEILWGRDWLEEQIGPFTFRISPASFLQINSIQTTVLYDQVLQYAALSGAEEVVDAYCGIGTISLFLAQKAKKVTGIEIVPEAIVDAQKNAKRNRVSNIEFKQGKAEKLLPAMVAKGIRPEVVVVDPPRKGCDRELLGAIITAKPQRVVYVSCNPSTLARDLRILVDGGYLVREVQPVDMFPQTGHVECVVLMSRVDK
jgi:23S rRNA (uracil1939-C5)-methyltransferase